MTFADFEPKSFKRIKDNISKHYPATSEKGIQAKFVNNADCFLDTEFAYNFENIKLRIDLVWIDTANKKIMFVELKTMGDNRLYTNEIYDQLKKYYDFALKFENDIVEYYKKVFEIKKKLNILPKGLNHLSSIKDFRLEKKPLLLFGDCQQEWIDNNVKKINARIDEVAVGAYYFGGTKLGVSGLVNAYKQASIDAIKTHFNETTVKISAQTYLRKFYNNLGFNQVGEEYLEDGIPHIAMIKE